MAESSPELVVKNTRVGNAAAEPSDIRIAGNRIAEIVPHDPNGAAAERERPDASNTREAEDSRSQDRGPAAAENVRVVDGTDTVALPGLMNAHTHTAMAMLRSYADDLPLMTWLEQEIWPLERKLSEDDIYWGARLGCLEMIRTGTTFFNDMYWHVLGTARATADAGLRAVLADAFIDFGDPGNAAGARDRVLEMMERVPAHGKRIDYALAPHAIYTVSEASLEWVAEMAAERDLRIHMHLSETAGEVETCINERGERPVPYLDRLGLLGPRMIAAHCVHLDDEEIGILAERGVHAVHNPVSNLKLASGGPMRYQAMKAAGINVLIGTDGAASNNNLDLLEELKFAALMAKHATADPTALPAGEAIALATTHAADAFGLETGRLAPGRLADLILVDLSHPFLFPGHSLEADLVYSAHGRPVVMTICDGRVLMEDGVIPDEAEIRREVRARWNRLGD